MKGVFDIDFVRTKIGRVGFVNFLHDVAEAALVGRMYNCKVTITKNRALKLLNVTFHLSNGTKSADCDETQIYRKKQGYESIFSR